jgi:hypothetical protein
VIGSLHPVTLSTGSTAYTKKWVPGVQKEKYQRNGAPTASENPESQIHKKYFLLSSNQSENKTVAITGNLN